MHRTWTKCIADSRQHRGLPPNVPLPIVHRPPPPTSRNHARGNICAHTESTRATHRGPSTRMLRARLSMIVSVDECAVAILVVHEHPTESPTVTVPSTTRISRETAKCGIRPGFRNSMLPVPVFWQCNFLIEKKRANRESS